jgi:hypothetical protein
MVFGSYFLKKTGLWGPVGWGEKSSMKDQAGSQIFLSLMQVGSLVGWTRERAIASCDRAMVDRQSEMFCIKLKKTNVNAPALKTTKTTPPNPTFSPIPE